ncbi:MAG TPA: AI-2E family transporter [Stellaceae bacterium]|nr:AI-2E family transporter [Stellaceae bacterium]
MAAPEQRTAPSRRRRPADPSPAAEPAAPLPELDRHEQNLLEIGLRFGALALLLYASFVLIQPFITVVIWSVILTVALYPVFERLSRWLGNRRHVAAAVVTLISLVVVIGPASWLVLDLIESVRGISEHLDLAALSLPAPPESIKEWPLFGRQLYDFLELASTNLEAAAAQFVPLLKPLAGNFLLLAANAGAAILMFFAAIIIAGFLFSPAPTLVAAINRLSGRLALRRGEEFVALAGATIRTVSRGVVGISALQALLAGIGLAVAHVPGTSLITSGVLIFGIIQIGAGIILIPLIIWAWFTMAPTAVILFTIYMVPVALIDNILRPFVMGRGLKTPMLVILIGVIGGTLAYGITGVFLGPILLAVIWELLAAWIKEEEAV